MLKPKINAIHFGDVYAENEILYLKDYKDYFYNIGNCIEKIQSQKKFVVIGIGIYTDWSHIEQLI